MSDSDDVEAIRSLIHEYAFRIDAGDPRRRGRAVRARRVGIVGATERMRGRRSPPQLQRRDPLTTTHPGTMHCMTNVTIKIDSGNRTASARTYFTVISGGPRLPTPPIIAGQYRDRFERHAGSGSSRNASSTPT